MTLEERSGWYLPKHLDSGKTFFDASVNTDQIGMEFEADIPENEINMSIFSDLLTKIWFKTYWLAPEFFGCWSITFQQDLCLKVAYNGQVAVIFRGCMQIWSVLTEISKKVLHYHWVGVKVHVTLCVDLYSGQILVFSMTLMAVCVLSSV